MDRRQLLKGMAGVAGSTAFLGGTRFASAQDYNAMIEASKSEGPLNVYSSFGDEFWPFVLEPFNKKYPWITVNYLDLNTTEAVQRYLLEQSAGSQTADMMVFISPELWHDLSKRGEIDLYTSAEEPNLPKVALQYPGIYTGFVDVDVLAWNSRLLPAELAPSGLEDLANKVKANPDVFAGKIVTKSALNESGQKMSIRALERRHGEEKLWEWLSIIGAQTRFDQSSASNAEKVLTGEALVAFSLSLGQTLRNMADPARASLFAWSFYGDGSPVGPRNAAVMKGATNVNSARLLLDTMLTAEGQAGVVRASKVPMRSDFPADGLPEGFLTYESLNQQLGAENVLPITFEEETDEQKADFIKRYSEAYKVST